MCQSAFLLLAKKPSDGGFDALLLWLLVEGVLAAGYAAQCAGLCLQRGHDPEPGETYSKVSGFYEIISHSGFTSSAYLFMPITED